MRKGELCQSLIFLTKRNILGQKGRIWNQEIFCHFWGIRGRTFSRLSSILLWLWHCNILFYLISSSIWCIWEKWYRMKPYFGLFLVHFIPLRYETLCPLATSFAVIVWHFRAEKGAAGSSTTGKSAAEKSLKGWGWIQETSAHPLKQLATWRW